MENSLQLEFENLKKELAENNDKDNFLTDLVNRFPAETTFSTSFSYEDQIITHLLKNHDTTIFTIDTGRLFEQTYETWTATKAFFKKEIKAYYPDAEELQSFVSEKGPDSFYQSVENRKQCCTIRKVHPLKKALKGYKIWITGLRAEHSLNRQNIPQLEWDEAHQIIKFHPILHWSSAEVLEYVKKNQLPYNYLHKQGFASIGCAPCTRAIQEGEDMRAGRWWWEDANKKECGLHVHQ